MMNDLGHITGGPSVLRGMHGGGRSHTGWWELEKGVRRRSEVQRSYMESRDGEGPLAKPRSLGLHPLVKGSMWAWEQTRLVASGMMGRWQGQSGQRPGRAGARPQKARDWREQDP